MIEAKFKENLLTLQIILWILIEKITIYGKMNIKSKTYIPKSFLTLSLPNP